MAGRRPLVLDVPVFAQREAECGNTSLKAALWHLGRRFSAAHLGRLAGLTPDGIDHGGLIDAARRAGAAVYARADGSLADLRWFVGRGLPVLVGWWSMGPDDAPFDPRWSRPERRARDCGHYSVIAGSDGPRLLLVDPQWTSARGRPRVVGRRWVAARQFDAVWYDTDGPGYRPVRRWLMVAHHGGERFAARRGGGRDHAAL